MRRSSFIIFTPPTYIEALEADKCDKFSLPKGIRQIHVHQILKSGST